MKIVKEAGALTIQAIREENNKMMEQYETMLGHMKDTIENREALDANKRVKRTLAYIGNHLGTIPDKDSFLREEWYRFKVAFDECSISDSIYDLDRFIFLVKMLESKPVVLEQWKPSK